MLFLNGMLILLAIIAFSLAYAHQYKKVNGFLSELKKSVFATSLNIINNKAF